MLTSLGGQSNWRELLRDTRLLAACRDFAIASGKLSTPSSELCSHTDTYLEVDVEMSYVL